MFYKDGNIYRSSLLDIPGTAHGFATRRGGVSTCPHTREMNLAAGHGDTDEIVLRNTDIFVSEVTHGELGAASAVAAPQIHSTKIRIITREMCGEGVTRETAEKCDGFVTDIRGVVPIVRVADCVPILMCAVREDGKPVVGAFHAGWRGTAAGMVIEGIKAMCSLGAHPSDIRAAVGAHIGFCCFEVKDDMFDSVAELRGTEFASRHIKEHDGALFADLSGMNLELLLSSGVPEKNIDISPECTCCDPEKYHSHRKTGGLRGSLGAAAAIL